jgi:hypothetical protein
MKANYPIPTTQDLLSETLRKQHATASNNRNQSKAHPRLLVSDHGLAPVRILIILLNRAVIHQFDVRNGEGTT